ncbi:unnamed protein product [Colias eurytheme]|nr:unnamed protein product [Colias eurytheme]
MDFINENIEVDKMIENVSRGHSKRDMHAILTKISEKPHGLYYQTNKNAVTKVKSPFTLYKNASLVDMTTTEISSTILDWVYDENVTTTEDTLQSTDMFTSSEFENVTEITLFDKKSTTMKPNIIPKKTEPNKCHCDLMYKTCDINCCCDIDCSETDKLLFDCERKTCPVLDTNQLQYCLEDSECNNKMTPNFLENLFCISKTNLPDKRLTDIQFDEAAINRSPKWHKHNRQKVLYEFKRNILYRYNEPVWLSRNGSIYFADIPVIVTNHYCSGMKPIKFLVNENVKCVVKLQDLHMFQVLKNVEGGSILSPMTNLTNSSDKNVTVHHTNWTLYICDQLECIAYNKSSHEPYCTESYCNNIATKVYYKFYYFDYKIIKAEIKLYIQKISMNVQFINQNVKVKFYLSNKPEEDIIKLSGNPGYIPNLPILISTAENNHTMHLFNNSFGIKNILIHPDNINGHCILTNVSYKIVQFGQNKRSKCRFTIKEDILNAYNATTACQNIQNNILHYLKLDSVTYVAPYGNPQSIPDENWIQIQMFDKEYIYGILDRKNSALHCKNVVTRIAYIIAYADTNSDVSKEQNKIVYVKVEGTAQNITFNYDDISTVLTVDTNFIDVSKPDVFEYAGAPHLKIYLPKSFFLPSNSGNLQDKMRYLTLILFVLFPCIIRLI